jgi:hypothetical protein
MGNTGPPKTRIFRVANRAETEVIRLTQPKTVEVSLDRWWC